MNLRPYSIHIITIFISTFLFFMIPVNDAQTYYTFGTETDFYLVMIMPIIVNIFNLLGTLYIFYRK